MYKTLTKPRFQLHKKAVLSFVNSFAIPDQFPLLCQMTDFLVVELGLHFDSNFYISVLDPRIMLLNVFQVYCISITLFV